MAAAQREHEASRQVMDAALALQEAERARRQALLEQQDLEREQDRIRHKEHMERLRAAEEEEVGFCVDMYLFLFTHSSSLFNSLENSKFSFLRIGSRSSGKPSTGGRRSRSQSQASRTGASRG